MGWFCEICKEVIMALIDQITALKARVADLETEIAEYTDVEWFI